MAKKSLGKGLGALIPDLPKMDKLELSEIPLEKIRPNPHQPRHTFDEESIKELAMSISTLGVIQPVIVRNVGHGFELIAGERRWRAARSLGLKTIPALIKSRSDLDSLKIALVENLQREGLSVLDEALGYQSLIEDHGLTQQQVADVVGTSRSKVANTLRILNLPPSIQEMLKKEELTAGHARAILTLTSEKDQLSLARKISEDKLSVRHIEKEVKKFTELGAKGPRPKPSRPEPERIVKLRETAERLKSGAIADINVAGTENACGVEIKFRSIDDLENFFAKLKLIT